MTKTVLSALGLILTASCSQNERSQDTQSQASKAIQALSARDEVTVAQCNRAVDACNERLPDAAATDVCSRLAEHCASIQERLAETRGPAVGCWRAVEECAEHAPEQAKCSRDESECEALEAGVTEERDRVADCSARVEACVTRSTTLPEAAAVACENIAAACEHAETAGTKPPDAGKGDDDQDGDDQDGDDQDGDDQDGDDQDGDAPANPRAGHGRPDAGPPGRD